MKLLINSLMFVFSINLFASGQFDNVLDTSIDQRICSRNLNNESRQEFHALLTEFDMNMMLTLAVKADVGGTSSNHKTGDELYLGCEKNITLRDYLGSEEAFFKFIESSKIIQNIYPDVDLAKKAGETIFCESSERMEKRASFGDASTLRSAKWLPERINGKDLVQINVLHPSYISNDTDEKINIIIKEMLHNYIPGYYSLTRSDKARAIFSVLYQKIYENNISDEQVRDIIATSDIDFPSSKVDDRLKLERTINILKEKIEMLERANK